MVDQVLKILEFKEQPSENVSTPTSKCYQTNDGTMFFFDKSAARLFVIGDGKETIAALPKGTVKDLAVFGSALYLLIDRHWAGPSLEIYKATNDAHSRRVRVELKRRLDKDERPQSGMIIGREVEEDELWVYRACDDPEKDRVLFDSREKYGSSPLATVSAVHRRLLILARRYRQLRGVKALQDRTTFHQTCPNILVISSEGIGTVWADDSCPFIFFIDGDKNLLSAFDGRTTHVFQLSERPEGYANPRFVGCEKLLISCCTAQKEQMFSADLPEEIMDEWERDRMEKNVGNLEINDDKLNVVAGESASNQVKSQASTPPDLGRFLKDFKPTKIIGRGAFGCVFEAHNIADNRIYAVKQISIPISDGESKVQHVLKEARVMAPFEHPNIVRYNASWIERPQQGWQVVAESEMKHLLPRSDPIVLHDTCVYIYIQMQLCSHSLADWLAMKENQTTRDLDQMKSWLTDIVEGVAYIHEMDIIHRDLKPSNILVDQQGRIRVCDLGIASELAPADETKSRTGDTGNLLYRAPEQFYWIYSAKVDVFALGLIYAELCVPMNEDERMSIFENYRSGLANDLVIMDAQASNLIARMTEKDSESRPTCREILDDLSGFETLTLSTLSLHS